MKPPTKDERELFVEAGLDWTVLRVAHDGRKTTTFVRVRGRVIRVTFDDVTEKMLSHSTKGNSC